MRRYRLMGEDGRGYLSDSPGKLGGHPLLKVYGRLDCPSPRRAIANGKYLNHRVFFAGEATAVAAGYRPCSVCMRDAYRAWKHLDQLRLNLRREPLMKSASDRVAAMLAKSVRELIEHVTWWDEEAIKHLPAVLEGKRPPKYSTTYGGIDAFNAWMTERKKSLSLDEVRGELSETHSRLVHYIQCLSPEAIVAQPKFRNRLRLDSYGHYPLHAQQIREWRAANEL